MLDRPTVQHLVQRSRCLLAVATSAKFRDIERLMNTTLAGHKLTTRLDMVLDRLASQVDEGYPSKASGGPNNSSNTEETFTLTERKALDSDDPARAARDKLIKAVLSAWATIVHVEQLIEENEPPDSVYEGTPKGWCASCYRIDQSHSPTGREYAGLCNWCGRFKAVHQQLPTEKLVNHHLDGKRITTKLLIAEGFKP